MKKRILVCIGTRPEAIKMAPVIKELLARPDDFETITCATAQHRNMLDQVIDFFSIPINYDLDLMQHGQDLVQLSSRLLVAVSDVMKQADPDLVLVHGDTSTAFMSALAAFYARIPVGHVEAGLRTFNLKSPFPEESNRQFIGKIATLHFAPTSKAFNNLILEGVPKETIYTTGNTVIDALHLGITKIEKSPSLELSHFKKQIPEGKIVLITSHRRENFGDGISNICRAIRQVALQNKDISIVFPVHLNPNILVPVNEILGTIDNVYLLEPLDYEKFIWLMKRSHVIITDSGGIQEEAPSLNKPVLVMRDVTERQEAVDSGAVKLVGNDAIIISRTVNELLQDENLYNSMTGSKNPYGDGTAASQIATYIAAYEL